MVKWYGLGEAWISLGLPMYISMDRKLENGCEIQYTACERSGIMLRLHLVTTAADQNARLSADESRPLHRSTVLHRLVGRWAGTGCIVCADSYVASVEASLSLKAAGFRFIGVVKRVHRRFPMTSLATRQLGEREDWVSMVHIGASWSPELMLWADRNRRYFVATAGSVRAGGAWERLRWRQVYGGAKRVAVSVPRPEVAEIYYGCCAQIDRRNQCRRDDPRLEHKLGTHDWSQRVKLPLFGILIVDSWLLHTGARGPASHNQAAFYEDLASGLIDNTLDGTAERPISAPERTDPLAPPPHVIGSGVHLTPTSKRRKGDACGLVTLIFAGMAVGLSEGHGRMLVGSVGREFASGL